MASDEDNRATKRARRQGRVFETPGDAPLLSTVSFDDTNAAGEGFSLETNRTSGRPGLPNLRLEPQRPLSPQQDSLISLPPSPFTPSFGVRFKRLLEPQPSEIDAVHDNDHMAGLEDSPAPAQHAKSPRNFDIFSAVSDHPELAFVVAKHLSVNSLVSLYAMSRPFHEIMDTRFTTMILSQACSKAFESARIFRWKWYPGLCQSDPAKRNIHPYRPLAEVGSTRDIPTFRWLKMVIFREKVCHEIMVMMAEDGVRLPPQCEQSLKKLWFLLDTPDNVRRIGLVHDKTFFHDIDLFMLTLLGIKMDMRFTDPVEGRGTSGLKRVLLAQSSLSVLWRTLKREILQSEFDVLRMFVRWKWMPRTEDRDLGIFGIPPSEIGMMQYEWHGQGGKRTLLMQPDDLISRECIKRSIDTRPLIKQMLVWGYVDPVTLDNCEPRRWERKLEQLKDDYDGDEDLGDDLLDLRVRKQISKMVLRD